MITLVEALHYRCLRYVSQPLGDFHVLVGPNASGKTTFLDVVGFLSDVASEGLDFAITNRTANPEDLLFRRNRENLELAVEARIPDDLRKQTAKPALDTIRYEIAIGFDESERAFEFKTEKLLLKKASAVMPREQELFPMVLPSPGTLATGRGVRDTKVVANKVPGGNDNFYSETYGKSGKGWVPSFKLGSKKSILRNLPADEAAMPVASWFREYLGSGVQRFILNSQTIKRPSPPTQAKGFLPDGSNLPWVVSRLRADSGDCYQNWIDHLQTALPDLQGISTIERPEDKHCYLVYEYAGGLKVPSWMVSDGTLRLTALTLPAYLNSLRGIYLIEEPENGIHPRAISTVYDSLSSVYSAQVLLASHSPVVLNAAEPSKILCFAKTSEGATDIVYGSEHPALRQWKEGSSLGTLLASGVLG